MKLAVMKWQKTNYKWWQFWKPSHTLEKIAEIETEKDEALIA